MDDNLEIPKGFFVAGAPGSIEKYLIPDRWHKDYLKWCACELFDERWQQWKEFFNPYEIIM